MSAPALLHDSLRHTARLYPGREAIRLEGSGLTYAQTWERSRRLASALAHGLGLEPGARFGVLTRNTPLFAELIMGASLSGTVCVPLNFRLAPPELAGIMADAEARLLLASPALEGLVTGTVEEGWDGRVVWLDTGYEDLLLDASADAGEAGGLEASGVVLQMYTSGTTGAPKGVMLSHRNLVANSWTGLAERNVVEGDVYLVSTPLCQIGGLSRLLTSIHTSAGVRLLERFDPERALALVSGGEVTTAFLVPTMIQDLLEAAGTGPVGGRFRRLCYGGSPIGPDLLRRAMEVLACEFQQGYGLTESSPNLTCLRPEDHVLDGPPEAVARLGSVGRESVGVRTRVVGPSDEEVAPGEEGEVVARGPNVMEGYWRRPEATAEAIRDGWLRTGDLATVDEDGYVFLLGRRSDMLISGGINVYPREVELELEAHPLVREAAVVGRADRRWGEVPVAIVVLAPGATAEMARERLDAHCRGRLAAYKAPRDYIFMDALPRNAMGKVLKAELRGRGAGPA